MIAKDEWRPQDWTNEWFTIWETDKLSLGHSQIPMTCGPLLVCSKVNRRRSLLMNIIKFDNRHVKSF